VELMTSTQKKMLRYGTVEVENRLKADFQSSHEAPRSSLRVLASN
jgi:hypothetical protein